MMKGKEHEKGHGGKGVLAGMLGMGPAHKSNGKGASKGPTDADLGAAFLEAVADKDAAGVANAVRAIMHGGGMMD